MQLNVSSYIAVDSPVHRFDARLKILLLLAYSVALFFADTWMGLGAFALAFAAAFALSRIPARSLFGLVAPVYVLAALTVVFNAFVVAPSEALGPSGFADAGLHPLVGLFSLSEEGLVRGCFFAARILLLVFASLIVTFSSTSTELTDALGSFLSPLRRLGFPVDDAAMVFSLALRFIPVTAEEFCRVRDAQWSRGSKLGEGTLAERLSAWRAVFVPLFVGLFRRADSLAQAMDARCYGASGARSSLSARSLRWGDVLLCGGVAALLVLVAVAF